MVGSIFLAAVITANTAPTPVEIWTAGSHAADIQRLSAAIEKAFKGSPGFVVSFGQKPGTIYVTLPASLDRHSVSGRTAVSAVIEFSHAPPNAPQELAGKVNCWEDDMTACGQDAVAIAEKFR